MLLDKFCFWKRNQSPPAPDGNGIERLTVLQELQRQTAAQADQLTEARFVIRQLRGDLAASLLENERLRFCVRRLGWMLRRWRQNL